MSEKVTFKELIESIAGETQNSQQFTHDFLKDFVEVINSGLEADGKVNIAGFGKFNLRRVDEREGYNPQTEEKMTIPAHNRVIFKPYKDVRELINAPYLHLEPELIEEDADNDKPIEAAEEKHEEAAKEQPEQPADPTQQTVPSPSIDKAPPSEEEPEKSSSQDEDDPFGLEQEPISHSSEITSGENTPPPTDGQDVDDQDIVEFNRDAENEKLSSGLEEFMGTESSSDDPEKPSFTGETANKDEHKAEPVPEESMTPPSDDIDISDLNETTVPADRKSRSRFIAAAAGILFLLAVGSIGWYYLQNLQGVPIQQMATRLMDITQLEKNKTESPQIQEKVDATPQKSPNPARVKKKVTPKKVPATREKNVSMKIEKGQTLWSIAREKYGNPRLWPWIYGNNEPLENPDVILAGKSLAVPLPSGPQNTLSANDSIGVAKGFVATYRWYKNHNRSKAQNHIWAATLYHRDIDTISDIKIDRADLTYVNHAR